MSDKVLAQRAGISTRTLSKVKRGCGSPRVCTLDQIAHALSINLVDLLKSDSVAEDLDKGLESIPDMRVLMHKLHQLMRAPRQKIIDTIKYIIAILNAALEQE